MINVDLDKSASGSLHITREPGLIDALSDESNNSKVLKELMEAIA